MAEKQSRNGNGAEYIRDPSVLFGPSHRRFEEVNLSDDEKHPQIVIVRAMSAGERDQLLGLANMPDPDKPGQMMPTPGWSNVKRNAIALALSCMTPEGEPLFVKERVAAIEALGGGKWDSGVLDSYVLEMDPTVRELLTDAADRLGLLTMSAMAEYTLKNRLARERAISTAGPTPTTSQTQGAS